jgi:G:T-mismatch repair DNA endonuclease (very short patch repair protein)
LDFDKTYITAFGKLIKTTELENMLNYQPTDDDFIIDGKTAKFIRERDEVKKKIYEHLGYQVVYVWSYDYKQDKLKTIENTINTIKIICDGRD